MQTCTVEVGLLKKHACGANAVTKCVNCEQPLCAKHALPRMSGAKKVFLCQECAHAWKESEKLGDIPATPATPPAAAKKPPEPVKPAAAAPKPAPAKPAAKKPEPAAEHSGALEFTPGKPAEPAAAPPAGKTELSIEQSAPLEFDPPPKRPADKK
jgi:hypothetical protein